MVHLCPFQGKLCRLLPSSAVADNIVSSSQRELEPPLVADALGKIYNKDALLEYLLAPPPSPEHPVSERPFGADGLAAAGHLRSLKDVQQLKLTPVSSNTKQDSNTAINAISGGQVEYGTARWECPITMRGMNGSVKFVYVKGCGCVASESGLKELAGVNVESPKEQENEGAQLEARKSSCPVCGEQLPGSKVELVTLNPVGEEKEAMAQAWKAKVAKEEKEKAEKKAAKKQKKRKDISTDGDAADTQGDAKKAKTTKSNDATTHAHQAAPSTNRKLPSVPEAKKPISAAVASLYASQKDDKSRLSPFFAGSYSRF